MQLDMLTILVPPKPWRDQFGLTGSTISFTYLSDPDPETGLQDLVFCKGHNVDPTIAGDYPWDWCTVNQKYIYQRLTEKTWAVPSSGKLCFGLGSPRVPRYIDYSENQPPGLWQFVVKAPRTDYVIFDGQGQPQAAPARFSNQDVRNTVSGPFYGAPVGTLPAGEDWVVDYERNGKNGSWSVKESITYRCVRNPSGSRTSYGRRQWQQFKWNGTQYVQDVNAQGQPLLSHTDSIVLLKAAPNPVQFVF